MHTCMGLQNDVLDELFIDISGEDKKEVDFENVDELKVNKLEELEEKREELEKELDEITLACSVHSSNIKKI